MNRIERQIRNMVNPFSTAFAGWWCHSGRYLLPVRMISGTARPSRRAAALHRHLPAAEMAARRAAVDAVLAGHDTADS